MTLLLSYFTFWEVPQCKLFFEVSVKTCYKSIVGYEILLGCIFYYRMVEYGVSYLNTTMKEGLRRELWGTVHEPLKFAEGHLVQIYYLFFCLHARYVDIWILRGSIVMQVIRRLLCWWYGQPLLVNINFCTRLSLISLFFPFFYYYWLITCMEVHIIWWADIFCAPKQRAFIFLYYLCAFDDSMIHLVGRYFLCAKWRVLLSWIIWLLLMTLLFIGPDSLLVH